MYCRKCGIKKIPEDQEYCDFCSGRIRHNDREIFDTENSTPKKANKNKGGCFSTIKNWFFIIVVITIGISIISIFSTDSKPPFPKPAGAKKVHYKWKYNGQNYRTSLKLHKSIDKFYSKKAQKNSDTDKEDYYSNYFHTPKKDKTISKLARKIKKISNKKGLNKNQTVELIVTFVQSMSYEKERINNKNLTPKFPYQVLYDKEGICSDLSILAASILREFNYGTALFSYNPENESDIGHMTLGVECPHGYSTYNSEYCVSELTSRLPIGTIPEIEPNGKARKFSSISNFDNYQLAKSAKKPQNVEIILKKDGKEYDGIVKYRKKMTRIKKLENYFEDQKTKIERNRKRLRELKEEMDYYYKIRDYIKYNELVRKYNSLLAQTKAMRREFNNKVSKYNKLVKQLIY